MIVASFLAPRYEKWPGCDYVALLRLLDASCRRLGLRHMVISDDAHLGLDTFLCRLPENLMMAILEGQRQFLACAQEPVLLVGADCLVTRDPRPFGVGYDMAITTSQTFSDCEMNTGAIWCAGSQCAAIWQASLDRNPVEWGDDQTALYAAINDEGAGGHGLSVRRMRCEDHNWAPRDVADDAGMPTVMHFRGRRKAFMADWAVRHMGLTC